MIKNQIWLPITSAPKDREILVYDPTPVYGGVKIAKWNDRHKIWSYGICLYCPKSTHWMPLPAPPKQ